MDERLFFGAMLVFAFGLVSKLAHKSPITAPMVFAGVAILSLTVIRMLSVIVLTVLISVFIHGLSALPLSGLYGRFAGKGNEKTG